MSSTGVRAVICGVHGTVAPPVAQILTRIAGRLCVKFAPAWTLRKANAFAQRYLARPRSSERLGELAIRQYEALFARLHDGDAEQMHVDLAEAGLRDAVWPEEASYDYIVLNGTTAHNVRRRIYAVARAVSCGALKLASTTQVLFLDGERPLFASESAAVLLDPRPYELDPRWRPPAELPTDERCMDEMLWQQMRLPNALRQRTVTFVHAPKKRGASRAQTADCVTVWAQSHRPLPGRILIVSNNPVIEYQRRVFEVTLERLGLRGFAVSGMGLEAEVGGDRPAIGLGLLLEALASTLFRANQQRLSGMFQA